MKMDSETKERSKWRRLEHLERAARQLTLQKLIKTPDFAERGQVFVCRAISVR